MYNGVVNVYKESGFTSHDVVAVMRGIYGQKRIGHTGTLDPMAEGVLPVCLGTATKLSELLTGSSKSYVARMKLGISTTTDDITGEVVNTGDQSAVNEFFDRDDSKIKNEIEEVFERFSGKITQFPPAYSAIKVNGKKLYEYARAGQEVPAKPREVEVFSLKLLGIDSEAGEISFRVECSKGTYVRSLIRDMGEAFGTFGTMSSLLRDRVQAFKADAGYKLDDLRALKEAGKLGDSLTGIESCFPDVPVVFIKAEAKKYLDNGNRLEEQDFELDGTEDLKNTDFFLVKFDGEIQALYKYDPAKKDYKVLKKL